MVGWTWDLLFTVPVFPLPTARIAARILCGGGDANTEPAMAPLSMPLPTKPVEQS